MTIDSPLRPFAPSEASVSGTLYGLPFDVETARLVVLPVPWEVTVSYGAGTARAPRAVLAASAQVDLHDSDRPNAWKKGIAMGPIPEDLERQSQALRPDARRVIEALALEKKPDAKVLARVNAACAEMVARVRREASALLDRGKVVAVLGGDHSVPLGLMQALAERYAAFGILHIDAHADLRRAYEGFQYSHASILYNALDIDAVSRVVQVGIRDYCDEELERIETSGGRVRLFDFRSLSRRRFAGQTWSAIAEDVVSLLPDDVYVSFDIDGLDPALCPNTGTPVPGGLLFEEALFLVDRLLTAGKRIVGFDLCEVSPAPDGGDEWDANVGARVLYRLSCAAMPED